jgi:FkbM family methyltransferase
MLKVIGTVSTSCRLLVDAVLRRFGWQAVLTHSTLDHQRADLLSNYAINLVIDVGANIGQWSLNLRAHGYEKEIISVECDPRALSILDRLIDNDELWTLERCAAGSEDKQISFYAWDNLSEGMSSTRNLIDSAANEDLMKSGSPTEIMVSARRLDSLLSDHFLQRFNVLLKIDVQGAELDVLVGSEGILSNVSLVEIELPLRDTYSNSVLAAELIAWLSQRGFRLATVQTTRWYNGVALDCDAIFVKASRDEIH